jgi:hypothetical protein
MANIVVSPLFMICSFRLKFSPTQLRSGFFHYSSGPIFTDNIITQRPVIQGLRGAIVAVELFLSENQKRNRPVAQIQSLLIAA